MSKKITLEEANKKLETKNIVLKNYDGILKPVFAVCKICGYEWKTQANVLLNNKCGCPRCNHKNASKKISFTKESFMQSCGQLKSDIIMTGEYTGFQNKTKFHCNTCNYDWETTPYMIKKFKTCPNCSGHRKLTREEYIKRIKNAHGNSYILLSDYISLSKKVLIKHITCGKEFETNALNFIGTGKKEACGCPYCSSLIKSKGEARIAEYLETNSYIFSRQYTFKKCKNKKRLPFDFIVFKDKEKTDIFGLIEYDGIQHFKYNETGIFTYKKFLNIKENDEIKNKFCKNNNIPLLRIKYTDFNNIKDKLDIFLKTCPTTIENTSEDGNE